MYIYIYICICIHSGSEKGKNRIESEIGKTRITTTNNTDYKSHDTPDSTKSITHNYLILRRRRDTHA